MISACSAPTPTKLKHIEVEEIELRQDLVRAWARTSRLLETMRARNYRFLDLEAPDSGSDSYNDLDTLYMRAATGGPSGSSGRPF